MIVCNLPAYFCSIRFISWMRVVCNQYVGFTYFHSIILLVIHFNVDIDIENIGKYFKMLFGLM